MTNVHPHAQLTQARHHRRFAQVGTAHLITLVAQHFGNTAHPDTANTDKMNAADTAHFRHHVCCRRGVFHIVPVVVSHAAPPHRYRPHGSRCPAMPPRVRGQPVRPAPCGASGRPASQTSRRHPVPVAATVLPRFVTRATLHCASGDRRRRSAVARTMPPHPPPPVPTPSRLRCDRSPDPPRHTRLPCRR